MVALSLGVDPLTREPAKPALAPFGPNVIPNIAILLPPLRQDLQSLITSSLEQSLSSPSILSPSLLPLPNHRFLSCIVRISPEKVYFF